MATKYRNLIYQANYDDGNQVGPYVSVSSSNDILIMHPNGKVGLTPIGGLAVKLTNATNANSVKGLAVAASTSSNFAFQVPTTHYNTIGIVYEDGVAANAETWVVVAGLADVLHDGASTSGDFVEVSGSVGRVSASLNFAGLSGEAVLTSSTHYKEIGYSLQSSASGSAALMRAVVHFN